MAYPSAFTRLPKSNVARFTLEGLIGAGKSRFLEALQATFASSQKSESTRRELTIVDEPVEKWCSTKDEAGKSVLSYFYDDTERYAFLFQINALMTRYGSTLEANDKIEQNMLSGITSHVLLSERTIGTDRNVFAKMLNGDGKINSMEYATQLMV
jgi:deoxyadenosine/deoxycytidine kinase